MGVRKILSPKFKINLKMKSSMLKLYVILIKFVMCIYFLQECAVTDQTLGIH